MNKYKDLTKEENKEQAMNVMEILRKDAGASRVKFHRN